MPRFPSFGRRKSTNVLEDVQPTARPESTFKVFERPGHGRERSFDAGVKLGRAVRPSSSPLHKEDNMFDHLKGSRGSGASNITTNSTTDNYSRFSAASTAPSSTDNSHHDLRSPHDKPFDDIPIPPVPKTSSGFSLKAAGRTFSFGRPKGATPPPHRALEDFSTPVRSPPPIPGSQHTRQRAVTASSYASTATPPKLDDRDLGLSLGGDFSDMFSGFEKRSSRAVDSDTQRGMSKSPVYPPNPPAVPSKASNARPIQPAALNLDRSTSVESSLPSWTRRDSSDRLMSASPVDAPEQYRDSPPPVPRHETIGSRPPRAIDNGLRRGSALAVRRQSTLDYEESVDEDARLMRESMSAARRFVEEPRARDSWLVPSQSTANGNYPSGSTEPTQRARMPVPAKQLDESMFDSQIASSANLAQAYEQKPPSPISRQAPKNKVMTPAQFERYRKEQERLRSIGGRPKDDDEDEADAYDDDEDETEKNRQIAKQRRKQEAHMAVYRQQMMKVTGETTIPAASSRPSMIGSQSTPNLIQHVPATPDEEDEEDEEVPLAILAAHGFPNKNRAPGRLSSMSSNPNLRASTQAGSIVGGDTGGRLPVFARNLPQDPYHGAGLVNATNRESLAYGGGAGSVHGGAQRGLPPGGLVGVIATEERSRAMRRGSPNTQGEYSAPPPANGFNGMGMQQNLAVPPMMRGMSNGMAPMMSPGEEAQLVMAQQMQQFMSMQMQFLQVIAAGSGSQAGGPVAGDMQRSSTMMNLPPPGLMPTPRPASTHGQQRAMSSLDPNSVPWMQNQGLGRQSMFAPSLHTPGNQYAPSIAPSERSNIGQPGRYRPVSHMPPADKSRSNTMSGALENWSLADNKQQPTIKMVPKAAAKPDEDDDEAGWEKMRARRERKRSMWRAKKETSDGFQL